MSEVLPSVSLCEEDVMTNAGSQNSALKFMKRHLTGHNETLRFFLLQVTFQWCVLFCLKASII